ncbi:homoprotocatechuate degradation operon regulator HpaR [Xenorhabdus anantnagensis]|uniref:Homoprotocatechuate degradation operon regulator HpaR n=1 Tax=Xenorhabdus anantnagensis TaxID=3025875 RepID=A0ABT5LR50_9GAMM|nr:homoprotocatechuate degradation operon regulator HpaR [Xenorhabdus anantnagensis]MDC9596699.1 homoprotocatechuate degradation operon regulator HpaR [Xenorhabdus anantnagensis]
MNQSLTISLLQAKGTAMFFFRPILKDYKLTEQQWRIISILAHRRSVDFHELSRHTYILRPSLTGILTRMEREGLIHRMKPLNDKRKLYISLTSKGQKYYDQVKGPIEESYKEIEIAFSPEKLTQFLGLLDEFNSIGNHSPEDMDEV